MLDTPLLLAGYAARPAALDDAEIVAELINICSMELTGKMDVDAAELRSDWSQPSYCLDADSIVVCAADGTLAGHAGVWDEAPHVRAWINADVHPRHRKRGIGSALAGWAEHRGRQSVSKAPEGTRVVLTQFRLSSDEAARPLLLAQGYQVVRHNLRMTIELHESPPRPAPPEGLVIRPFDREREVAAVSRAVREEFADHWGFVAGPEEEDLKSWQHWMDTSPAYDQSLLFVALDGDEIAGTAFCNAHMSEDPALGWVFALGVRRPWRRRGLALALLLHCFYELHRRGKTRVDLGVDAESLTGATRLYEKAGMRVYRQSDMWEKELRAGIDLSTRGLQ